MMKQLDLRFVKERDDKKLKLQLETMHRLQEVLTKRIAEKFQDVQVRIRFSSSQSFDVSGFSKEEKARFMEYMEDLWNDSTLLD